MPLVGWILILMAALSVGTVLFMVMREPQETEEWYIPPSDQGAEAKQESRE